MIWNEIWEFLKRNLFSIVLVAVMVVVAPWSLVFVLPVAILFLLLLVFLWRIRRQQQKMFEQQSQHRAGGGGEQQSQRTWWHRTAKNEGEVTVVQTEPTEQRVSDDVGEYVDFKEVKDNK